MLEILTSRVALSNALSGAAADAFSTLALYPLDKLKILMQADSKLGVQDAMNRVMKAPLHGVESKLISSVQQKFQYFYVYIILNELYKRQFGGRKPGVAMDLFIGYLAAVEGLATTLPLEVTSTRLITTTKKDGKHHTFIETFMEQFQNEGFLSFYKTMGASAILCINPAITYVIFEEVKTRILNSKKISTEVLSTLEALLVGIIAKSIATVVTFPFIRAKVLMSVWKKKHDEKNELLKSKGQAEIVKEPPTVSETLHEVYEHEGVAGLFVGLEPQLIKGVTNAALMLAVKENIYTFVKGLVLGGK